MLLGIQIIKRIILYRMCWYYQAEWFRLWSVYLQENGEFYKVKSKHCRSQWLHGLWRRSVVTHLLRLWLQILPGAWVSACCECCLLSARGLCDELITHPEESFWLVCCLVQSRNLINEETIAHVRPQCQKKKKQSKHLHNFSLQQNSIIVWYLKLVMCLFPH